MDDRVPAADQTPPVHPVPPIPDRVLNIAPISLSQQEIKALGQTDRWFKSLTKQAAALKANPGPSMAEIRAAWQEVVKAYWIWIHLAHLREERKERLKLVTGQMRRRLIELRKKATFQQLHKLRVKMGRRFWHSPQINSAAGPAPKGDLPPVRTLPEH